MSRARRHLASNGSCVGTDLSVKWDIAYIFYVLLTACVGSYVGLMMVKYAKKSILTRHRPSYRLYIVASGITFGGSVWTTHFVGVESLRLFDCRNDPVPESFEVKLWIYSALIAVLGATASMHFSFGGPPVKRKKKKRDSEYKSLLNMANDDATDMDCSQHSHSSAGSSVSGISDFSTSQASKSQAYSIRKSTYQMSCGKLTMEFDYVDWNRFTAAVTALSIGGFVAPHFMIMFSQQGPYVVRYKAIVLAANVVASSLTSSVIVFLCIQTAKERSVAFDFYLRLASTVILGGLFAMTHYIGMIGHDYEYRGHRGGLPTSAWYTTYIKINGSIVAIVMITICLVELVVAQYKSDRLVEDLRAKAAKAAEKLPGNVQEVLEEVYDRLVGVDEGEVATYIPELANCNPDAFGISLCDLKGEVYSVGECNHQATIQSVGKTMLYVLAMVDSGRVEVDRKIGQEPSGRAFNELAIDGKNRAYNPLINTGALVSASFLKGESASEKYSHFERRIKKCVYAPASIHMDESVYRSEWDTCGQNRELVRALVERKVIEQPEKAGKSTAKTSKRTAVRIADDIDFDDASPDIESPASEEPRDYAEIVLDAYTRACSLNISANDLAVMGALFAGRGRHPVSGKRVLPAQLVDHLVTVMMSCGMYNGAGKWIVDVGIPAKSGVSGFLLCVVPDVCGIAVYSPRLDKFGNSRRGVLVCEALSTALNLHILKKFSSSAEEGDGCVDESRPPEVVST